MIKNVRTTRSDLALKLKAYVFKNVFKSGLISQIFKVCELNCSIRRNENINSKDILDLNTHNYISYFV